MGPEWVTGPAQIYAGCDQEGGNPSNLMYMLEFQEKIFVILIQRAI
jgi:hypothetical protein